jgi:PDZ domain-containing protein
MRVTPRRILAALGLALVVALAVLWLFPSDDYLLLPDPAHPVGPKVFVANSKRDNDGGGIYFVDVILRRAKLFESIFPGIHSGASLVPARAINPPGVNDQARREEDLREMVRSQSIAAAVALRAAGYKVVARPVGVLVSQVDPSGPAAGALEPTDLIVAVDGKTVRTPNALRRIMQTHRPGDRVRFTFHRGKTIRQATLKTVADPSDPKRAIVGILIDQAADIKLPVKVRINLGDVGGPSAGLAFALEVMEKLGRDVDHGNRVAATGEIGLDGSVGPIGGVKQKTLGARKSHVDVFLVPAGDNAAEARRYADGLRIIPVRTFQQALRALATLPRKS